MQAHEVCDRNLQQQSRDLIRDGGVPPAASKREPREDLRHETPWIVWCGLGDVATARITGCFARSCVSERPKPRRLGWCYPNIGGTVGQTWEAAKKGDWDTVAKGVGDVLITVKCPLCAVAGQVILKKEDRALISTIVGRGVILSSVGVPTVLVVADGVTGAAQAITLRGRGQEQPMQQPALPSRAAKSFVADTPAACIVDAADDGAKVTAGWVSAPAFVDEASRDSVQFPEIDLRKGDILKIRAPECAEYAKLPGQRSLTEVVIAYDDSQIVPGSKEKMKFFIWGRSEGLKMAR